MSMKRRVVIAVVAIAVIHGGVYLFASRPRFYEPAWRDAVGVLKRQVGKAAVENGVFTIPRRWIVVPRRDVVLVGKRGSPWNMLHGRAQKVTEFACLVNNGEESRLIRACTWSWYGGRKAYDTDSDCAVEGIKADAARHARAVIAYLGMVKSAGQCGLFPDYEFQELVPVTTVYPSGLVAAPFTPYSKTVSVRLVQSDCIARYLEDLLRGDVEHLSSASSDVVPALLQVVKTAFSKPQDADMARFALGILRNYPDKQSIPILQEKMLQEAARLASSRKGVAAKIRDWPFVGRFFAETPGLEYLKEDVDRSIWSAETFADGPKNEKWKSAAEALATDADAYHCRSAAKYIGAGRDSGLSEYFSSNYGTMCTCAKYFLLQDYEQCFGNDQAFARTAASDPDAGVKTLALWNIHRITGADADRQLFLEALPSADAVVFRMLIPLEKLGFDSETLERASALLRARYPSARCGMSLPFSLADVGGEDNIRFLGNVLAAPVPNGAGTGGEMPRIAAAMALAYTGDPRAIKELVAYLRAPVDEVACGVVLRLAALTCDEETLDEVDSLVRAPSWPLPECRDEGVFLVNAQKSADPVSFIREEFRRDIPAREEYGEATFVFGPAVQHVLTVAAVLAERLTEDELERALADEPSDSMRYMLYLALVRHRFKAAESAQPRPATP